jgi:hypothetical protein
VIDVPTCHVANYKDPYIKGFLDLNEMFDGDVTTIFDHDYGQAVLWRSRTAQE